MAFESTKIIELGSAAFRQWKSSDAFYDRQEQTNCFCSYAHGYRLTCKIWFACEELDERNWVFDFGDTRQLKKELEYYFDHTLCVAFDDPCLDLFKKLDAARACQLRIFENGVGIEKFAEFVYNKSNEYVTRVSDNRVWVSKVEMWEHEKNSAIYTPGNSVRETLKAATELMKKVVDKI